jgi:hypothetical protein
MQRRMSIDNLQSCKATFWILVATHPMLHECNLWRLVLNHSCLCARSLHATDINSMIPEVAHTEKDCRDFGSV